MDDVVTIVLYKAKTIQSVLTEIAGLLVIIKILAFTLKFYNEKRFLSKMKREGVEDFREVFTYSNFKGLMLHD